MWTPFRNVHIWSTMWFYILDLRRVLYQFCREAWFVITVIFQFAHISKRSAKNHSSPVYLYGWLGLINSVGGYGCVINTTIKGSALVCIIIKKCFIKPTTLWFLYKEKIIMQGAVKQRLKSTTAKLPMYHGVRGKWKASRKLPHH